MHDHCSQPRVEARAASRSNMFIAAVLSWADSSSAVKIRNMSPSGALVEAPVLPPSGTAVRLVRGSLAIDGTAIWLDEDRCGLRFQSLAVVREWMAPASHHEQARVDRTVALLKDGAVPFQDVRSQHPAQPRTSNGLTGAALAADLREVLELLSTLSAELAGDAHVVNRHARALQNFDVAGQTIEAVVEALTGQNPAASQDVNRQQSLRASRASALASRTAWR